MKINVTKIQLGRGAHSPDDGSACVMELASYLAHEKWSDHPACASPIIASFLRRWNDDLDDETRQKLKPYAAKVIGTRATKAVEGKRAWLITDWMVRVYTPAWLELGGMKPQADMLRALPEITDSVAAKASMPAIGEVRDKAAAARDAARAAAWAAAWAAAGDAAWAAARAAARAAAWAAAGDAAWAAAGDAARDAAWAAAGDAARAAAWAAAGDAAWDAARDAAWAAAEKSLQPTVVSLQASAFDLLDRLIALSPKPKPARRKTEKRV